MRFIVQYLSTTRDQRENHTQHMLFSFNGIGGIAEYLVVNYIARRPHNLIIIYLCIHTLPKEGADGNLHTILPQLAIKHRFNQKL